MAEGVKLHNEGQYEEALALRVQAHGMAPDDSFQKGRAARDSGASCDRLGRTDEAEDWAVEAFGNHDGLVKNLETPTREALRERSASAMYVAVNGMRRVIKDKLRGQQNSHNPEVVRLMRLTWLDIQAAKKLAPKGINQKFDQYEINAARRVSIVESLAGSKRKGLVIGVKAVGLAFMSESPKIDSSDPSTASNKKRRTAAKIKALIGAGAALGVNLLTRGRRIEKTALKLADKAL